MKAEFRLANGRVLPPRQKNVQSLEDAKQLEQDGKAYKSLQRSLRLIGWEVDRFSGIDNNESWNPNMDYPFSPSGLKKLIPGAKARHEKKLEEYNKTRGQDFSNEVGHVITTASKNDRAADVELRFDPNVKVAEGPGLALPAGVEGFQFSVSPGTRSGYSINQVEHVSVKKDGSLETLELGITEYRESRGSDVKFRDSATIVADHEKGILTYEYQRFGLPDDSKGEC